MDHFLGPFLFLPKKMFTIQDFEFLEACIRLRNALEAKKKIKDLDLYEDNIYKNHIKYVQVSVREVEKFLHKQLGVMVVNTLSNLFSNDPKGNLEASKVGDTFSIVFFRSEKDTTARPVVTIYGSSLARHPIDDELLIYILESEFLATLLYEFVHAFAYC